MFYFEIHLIIECENAYGQTLGESKSLTAIFPCLSFSFLLQSQNLFLLPESTILLKCGMFNWNPDFHLAESVAPIVFVMLQTTFATY